MHDPRRRSQLQPSRLRNNSKSSNISIANSSHMFVVVEWETHLSLKSLRNIGTFDLAARVPLTL
mgnify:CR=1 FL=1